MIKGDSQLDKAVTKLLSELRAGLKHGFFEYRIRCEIGKGRKRELILDAGKTYKFTIPEDEADGECERIGDS